jgi:hypothetical protein
LFVCLFLVVLGFEPRASHNVCVFEAFRPVPLSLDFCDFFFLVRVTLSI